MRFKVALVALLVIPTILHAQQRRSPQAPTAEEASLKEFIVANYTKYEYRIPMRDGTKLFTAVYVPKDETGTQRYPIMLFRTPYSVSPYGVDSYRASLGPSEKFARAKYIFAYQDVRGAWMSEGTFENMRAINPKKGPKDYDESTDAYDTVDWLIKNVRGNNGRVGQWGISYPGFYTAAALVDSHPALKAASPQAPVTDWFIGDDFHHNGALFLPHCFNFMANFGKARPEPRSKNPSARFDHGTQDGYEFFLRMGPIANAEAKYLKGDVAFWSEMVKHGTYDDYWQSKNLRPHLKVAKPVVLTVGGWFDAENLFGALEVYKHLERDEKNTTKNHIVMGPWVHGGWARGDGSSLGPVQFASKTSKSYQESIEFPFFEDILRKNKPHRTPKATMFETGTNCWRRFTEWPPKDATEVAYRFGSAESLAQDQPETEVSPLSQSSEVAFDEFISDPAKPVPYFERIGIGMDREYLVGDQRFASRRPDVLTYATPIVEKDVSIAGPIEVELHVATTGTDADWVVKVIDVYPNEFPELDPNPKDQKMGGYQQLLRGDVFRGKFRESFEKPVAFKPGEPTVVKFTMPDVCHCFRSGHRIMVQVQSSWFPLVDRNPQTFCDIYSAKEGDFKKAMHRVYRGGDKLSKIKVWQMP